MLTENEREMLLKVVHDLEKIVPDFKSTYQYLRKRRNCPGTATFNRGIKKMDKFLLKVIGRINENK